MSDLTYTMLRKGGTTGAVTGRHWSWLPGAQLTAPEGEFAHLPGDMYRTDEKVETTSAVPERETAAHVGLTKEHTGGGWYEIRRGSEVIEKVRGEDAADAYIEDHEA